MKGAPIVKIADGLRESDEGEVISAHLSAPPTRGWRSGAVRRAGVALSAAFPPSRLASSPGHGAPLNGTERSGRVLACIT